MCMIIFVVIYSDGNGYISDIELDEAVTNVTNHMSSTGGSSPYSKPAISQSANQYEVTLTKTNNSLGLNVTVSQTIVLTSHSFSSKQMRPYYFHSNM